MHPYRGIIHTDIWSDGIYTIPDELITLTFQYTGTNNSPLGTLAPWNRYMESWGPLYSANPHTERKK